MEQLIKELKTKMSLLKKNGENRYNLMDIGFLSYSEYQKIYHDQILKNPINNINNINNKNNKKEFLWHIR